MRDTSARREQIVTMLRTQRSVQVYPLAEMFNVSAVTIRKDLKFLEDRGVATRAYGGAILNDAGPEPENAITQKQQLNTGKKSSIGRLASSLVSPGDSIILDSGTTTNKIVPFLKEIDDLTLVTNDLLAINQLAEMDNVELIVLGGILRRKSMFFHGLQAEQTLRELHVDKLFLGVDGFHMEKGITTHFEPEATLNRTMCQAASEIIVVTDSSKFNKICLHKIIEPTAVTTVITDNAIPEEFREGLVKLGVKVITTDAE